MKRIILPISLLFVTGFSHAQTDTENYIQSRTYLEPVTTTSTTAKQVNTVQYFDGLGRPKQTVNVKASPMGRDVVTPIEYDQFGRQTKDYLPIPQLGTQNGAIIPNPLANSSSVYGSEKIYAEKILENSPLNRIQQQIQVGNDWANKPVKLDYDANIWEDYVRKYETTTTWVEGRTQTSVQLLQYFQPSQLYKNTVTDEDGNKTIEFKNGKGQVVLVRKVLNATQNTDTYYVYNEYDQLAFVIPPQASAPTVETATVENFYYQYRYDGRNRLVEKKLPGKGWEYMVYDKQDRLVLTQDANLQAQGKWFFTKYDQFSRPIYTGILDSPPGRIQQVNAIEGHGSNNEARNTTSWNNSGIDVYYTNGSAYPTTNFKLLSVNYYDTYPLYSFNPSFPSAIQGEPTLTDTTTNGRSTKGLSVMSLVKNIEDDNWTKNYTYYDTKGRAVGSYSINHLGGYTKTESKLDFAGVAQAVITKHKRLETDTERVITENFTYDHQNRLLVHKHQVDSNPEEILTQNTYNELSQLSNKKVGGTVAVPTPLQSIDYTYNIRGWMTKINDPSNLNGKLFGYEIRYNNPAFTNLTSGRFNGNIAEVDWKNASEGSLKRYSYIYDGLNRLKDAIYTEPGSTNPYNYNFNEHLTYDLNGNISTLKRNAYPVSGTTATQVDDLEYVYTGNRLIQVIEHSPNNSGYEGGNNIIDYDLNGNGNGNMINMKDKGIQSIAYNFLNLPNVIGIQNVNPIGNISTTDISHLYRADGVKLRKTFSQQAHMGLPTTRMTDYLDGFQYSYENDGGLCLTCRTESAYEMQAYSKIKGPIITLPSWKLDFVPTSEGFYSFTENRYIYQYKDHLGNVRVTFVKNNAGVLQAMDTNNYYPFGLNHIGGSFSSNFGSYYNYKYNGKELQETGWSDYGARMYMADLGRWGVVDPLAEKSSRWSPYNYAFNNPISFIDPDGRDSLGWGLKNGIWSWEASLTAQNYQQQGFEDYKDDGSIISNAPIQGQQSADTGQTYLGFNGQASYIPTNSNGSTQLLGLSNWFRDAISGTSSAISSQLSGGWDSNLIRSFTGDFTSIGVGYSGISGIGAGGSFDINWVLHGPEASFYPAITTTPSFGGGYSAGTTINIGSMFYTGAAKDITRSMLITNTAKGDEPADWVSGGAVFGAKVGVTGSAAKLSDGKQVIGGQINIGFGLPAGPVPVNAAAGFSNTYMIRDFGIKR